MTKPDWADKKVLDIAFKDEPGPLGVMYTIPAKYVAQALREAYTAGLERAARIADEAIIVAVEVHGDFAKGAACSELAAAIRAEKEVG